MHFKRSQKRILQMMNENFVNAYLETAAECIPAKQRVPWETLVAKTKHADVKTASKCNRRSPSNINALKL